MASCCILEKNCTSRKCKLSSEEKLEIFEFKEQFIKDVCSSQIKHKIPEDELNDVSLKLKNFKETVIGVYYFIKDWNESNNNNTAQKTDLLNQLNEAIDKLNKKSWIRAITFGYTTVGFFGHFTSGKSSFLNKYAFRENMARLPVAISPSSAVPTYLIKAPNNRLIFENRQDNIVLKREINTLQKIVHSNYLCGFPWSSIIKNIYCFSSDIGTNQNLIYIDLPGTSTDIQDDQISLNAMFGCDKLVYFVELGSGGLSTTDIKHIKEINQLEIPVIIILSKTDLKPPNEIAEIKEQIISDLKKNSIKYIDVALYTIYPEKFEKFEKIKEMLKSDENKIQHFISETYDYKKDLEDINKIIQRLKKDLEKWFSVFLEEFRSNCNDFAIFLGNNELDHNFFDSWKQTSKQIISSTPTYLNKTQRKFREDIVNFDASTYYKTAVQSINNLLNNIKHYNSIFNSAYISLVQQKAISLYWEMTAIAEKNKSMPNNKESIEKTNKEITNMEKDYNAVRDCLITLLDSCLTISKVTIEKFRKLTEDVENSENELTKSYITLVKESKKFERIE